MIKLKREIGVFGLSANIVNSIIGAGIFAVPAIIAAQLGSASILAYIICGFIIALIMLCIAEIGSKITITGGVYSYVAQSLGMYPGFLVSILLLLATMAANAAIGNAIIEIVFKLIPGIENDIIRILFFIFLYSGFVYLNIRGVKKGIGFVKFITVLKIVPLLVIVFLCFGQLNIQNLYFDEIPGFRSLGETCLILFFAFQGAGAALSVSGEVINPNKTIPKAILISIIGVVLLYVLVQTVAQGVLGDSLPEFVENPLGEVANRSIGALGFSLLTIGAAVSMFGTVSSLIMNIPRVLFAASLDNVIPVKALSKVHEKYTTPYISIIVFAILSFFLACLGGFKYLAIISSASSLLISLGICIAVIKLRIIDKNNSNEDTFRIPGGYTVPLLSIVFIIFFLSYLESDKIIAITVFIIAISVFYFIINFLGNRKLKNN